MCGYQSSFPLLLSLLLKASSVWIWATQWLKSPFLVRTKQRSRRGSVCGSRSGSDSEQEAPPCSLPEQMSRWVTLPGTVLQRKSELCRLLIAHLIVGHLPLTSEFTTLYSPDIQFFDLIAAGRRELSARIVYIQNFESIAMKPSSLTSLTSPRCVLGEMWL